MKTLARLDRRYLFAWALITALWASNSFAQVSIYPPTPGPYETVRVEVPEGPATREVWDRSATRVEIADGKVFVVLVVTGQGVGLPEPFPALDLPIGQFPGGNRFEVEVRVETPAGGLLRVLGTTSFVVRSRAVSEPIWNLTDLWWNPDESGWGVNISQHGSGVIFATWFFYGDDGKPVWYVMPEGRWSTDGMLYQGPVYRTSGPPFCYGGEPCLHPDFDPSKVVATLVGEASISVNGANFDRISMDLTIDGKSMSRVLRRQSF